MLIYSCPAGVFAVKGTLPASQASSGLFWLHTRGSSVGRKRFLGISICKPNVLTDLNSGSICYTKYLSCFLKTTPLVFVFHLINSLGKITNWLTVVLLVQKITWLYWHFNEKHFTILNKNYEFYSWLLMQWWNKILKQWIIHNHK